MLTKYNAFMTIVKHTISSSTTSTIMRRLPIYTCGCVGHVARLAVKMLCRCYAATNLISYHIEELRSNTFALTVRSDANTLEVPLR